MKLFKKAREAFNRMVSRGADAPPPVRPPPSTVDVSGSQKVSTAQVIRDPRYKYQLAQRDFEMRAKATTILHTGGTFNKGRNRDKRRGRAEMILRGASPRVAKRKQCDGITFEPVPA